MFNFISVTQYMFCQGFFLGAGWGRGEFVNCYYSTPLLLPQVAFLLVYLIICLKQTNKPLLISLKHIQIQSVIAIWSEIYIKIVQILNKGSFKGRETIERFNCSVTKSSAIITWHILILQHYFKVCSGGWCWFSVLDICYLNGVEMKWQFQPS